MDFFSALPLELMADANAASEAMRAYLAPVIRSIIAVASIAAVLYLMFGGIQWATSRGDPEKLEQAKKIIRNALIGLVLMLAAATITAILSHAYNSSSAPIAESLPQLNPINASNSGGGITELLINAVVDFLKNIIESAAKPFIDALNYFTNATPLMAENSGVLNLWIVMVAITDALFVLVVVLLAFHIMNFSVFGFEEINIRQLLPKLGLVFLLINTSIFAIDAIISLSNGMIAALKAGFSGLTVWDSLKAVVDQQGGLGLAGLLLMIVFVVLTVVLLVYYVLRLVVLYIGAVLAPIVFAIWLLPPFKDFAESAMKTYVTTIFVLFIHVVILQLASSIFAGMLAASGGQPLNPFMSMIVGIATVLALLKTQSTLSQMSYASVGPRAMSKMGGKLMNAMSYYGGKKMEGFRAAREASKKPPTLARVMSGQHNPRMPSKTVITTVRPGRKQNAKNNITATSVSPSLPKKPLKSDIGKTRVAPPIRKDKK